MKKVGLITLLIYLAMLVGEIRCIYKACVCNWEPVGKAEVIYTIGACSGLGVVIGYINIEDK